jgi:hypothetical protein
MPTIQESTASGNASMTIRGQEVPVDTQFVEHKKLRFFPDNPRIYSIVRANSKDPSQEDIQEQLLQLEHVRTLIADIRQNGGLTDPIIVIDGSFEVVEGNSRLAAYRHLATQDPVKWAQLKCTLLPASIDHSLVFALLGQYHIKGKKDWKPYEQAGFLYRRFHEHKIDMKTLATDIGLSSKKIRHLIDTYQFMLDHNETDIDRWSFYDEYLKSSKIRKARETYSGFDNLIVGKINDEEIKKAMDLRDQLPTICAAAKVLKKFATGQIDFEDAHDAACAGGGESSELKRVEAFRKWVASDKAEGMLRAKGQVRDKILFELNKIHSRVGALRARLSNNS